MRLKIFVIPGTGIHYAHLFMSDYVHLMKTTRNNIENSHGNTNTKNLHVSILSMCIDLYLCEREHYLKNKTIKTFQIKW